MREVLIGQTDYSVFVKIIGTDGAPETGLAHTDIDIAYTRLETDNDVTTADVTPADLANLSAAHSDWGWEEVSSTDHPGLYRLDIADAVFASGAWEAVVTITDASGTDFYPVDIGFRLVNIDPQASNLPANVTQFGGSNGTFSGGRPEVNVTHVGGTAGGTGVLPSGCITSNVLATGCIGASQIAGGAIGSDELADGAITSAKFAAGAINADAIADNAIDAGAIASDAITSAKIADSALTANKLATGAITSAKFAAGAIDAAAIASDAITDAKVASDVTIASVTGAVGSVTGNVGGNVAGSVGSVSGAVGSVTGNVGGNVAGSVGSVTGSVGGNVTGSVGSLATQAKADVNTEVLDVVGTDTLIDGKTLQAAVRIILAAVAGRLSGAGTGTETFLGADESTTRLVVSVDNDGNRTDVTYS